jgi:hypothetical protein
VTRPNPPIRSITFEPSERYSIPRPAGTLNIVSTSAAMRSASPRSSRPRSLPFSQEKGDGAVARPPYST